MYRAGKPQTRHPLDATPPAPILLLSGIPARVCRHADDFLDSERTAPGAIVNTEILHGAQFSPESHEGGERRWQVGRFAYFLDGEQIKPPRKLIAPPAP
jgi:hypothetical protein